MLLDADDISAGPGAAVLIARATTRTPTTPPPRLPSQLCISYVDNTISINF